MQPASPSRTRRGWGFLSLFLSTGCGSVGLSDATSDGTHGQVEILPEGEINFGSVVIGRPVQYTLEAVSTGIDPVTVEEAWFETDNPNVFYVGSLPFPREIDPGDRLPFEIKFRPETTGGVHATLVVSVRGGETLERNVVGNGCIDHNGDNLC